MAACPEATDPHRPLTPQVTRSLGDFDEKGRGVSAVPEVVTRLLGPSDHFLLLATDGLWDCVDSAEAVRGPAGAGGPPACLGRR